MYCMSFLGIFGDQNEKHVKKLQKIADAIEALEPQMEELTDEQLKDKTQEFRDRFADGETLDELLPEAFAVVREGSKRVLGMRPFRVQLIGGIVLHQGRIAEMRTGEGKTLVATLPAYLNAIESKGVHIVTVNEYLASFHSEWMGKLYNFLGITVGTVLTGMDSQARQAAYNADITYGTNSEFGFDYLRDNMVIYAQERCQRSLNFAIVDEVDSILIDEARTPLIISGAGDKSTEMYNIADKIVNRFKNEEDFTMDEKTRTISLSEDGARKCEAAFKVTNLSDVENTELSHHINQALKANFLFKLDKDYVVTDGQVKIVDEFTGRILEGRRYSEGLHQAIEAKEHVKVERESQTLATITYQNYFRMYTKLAGMTGTAKTEEEEFQNIYNLDVVLVPTNMPMIREDNNDMVYRTVKGKFDAVVKEVMERNLTGQPVLVGTVSVEISEIVSALLKRNGVKHEVLNAKHHFKEAEIVAQAGRYSAVTIATNMAGRGTDILLGGNPDFMARRELRKLEYSEEIIELATGHQHTEDELILEVREKYSQFLIQHKKQTDEEHEKVVSVGGLHIIGTERHESRRIDNQLRGRAGRQGDPGSSRFYISLEDDLMRLFGGDRVINIVEKLGLAEDQAIEAGILSKQIENAQKKVEAHNYEIRKSVLEYDDVMNVQRGIIYKQRHKVLEGENINDTIMDMLKQTIEREVAIYTSDGNIPEDWDIEGLYKALNQLCTDSEFLKIEDLKDKDKKQLNKTIFEAAQERYAHREELVKEQNIDMREVERVILLRCVDNYWKEHIDAMEQLRQGISLRSFAQKNPITEYKLEGFDMFDNMIIDIQQDTVRILCNMSFGQSATERKRVATPTKAGYADDVSASQQQKPDKPKPEKSEAKAGRNDPCPCGSGKKYKNCCGQE